jgi:hypothetical protein
MKTCTKCGVDKPFTDFHSEKRARDGLRSACKDCILRSNKAWREKHPDTKKASCARWNERNVERLREIKRASEERARSKDPGRFAAKVARWRSSKRKAEPVWADQEMIRGVYRLAAAYRKAGVDAHVDHVVPLQSPLVCGLHVQDNLIVLPASENRSKGNRRWPDMP